MVTQPSLKRVKRKTGAGMMECKKVLNETDGDLESNGFISKERGILKG